MKSLGEAIPEEQARVREVLGYFKAIGPAGTLGAMMIEQALSKADRAVMSGDPVSMIAAYQELKSIKE